MKLIFPAAVVLAGLLSGCSKASPTPTAPGSVPSAPAPPASVPITTSSLSLGGADGPFVTGDTAQLAAIATLSDGSRVDVTPKVAWRSGNPAVATVSAAGMLQMIGVGNTDIVASYDATTVTVGVTAGYDLSGVVHETDPFAGEPIANAKVDVIGGPWAGRSTVTDSTGRFALRGVTGPGFALVFSKPGYEFLRYGIVDLPRDAHPNVTLFQEQKTFSWELPLVASHGWYIEQFHFPIWISRTSPLRLIVVGRGQHCALQGTYTDFGAVLEGTEVRAWVPTYSPQEVPGIYTGTAPAGRYRLSIYLTYATGGPDCVATVTMTYY